MQPVKLAVIAFNFFGQIKSEIQINYESLIMQNPIHTWRDRLFTD